MLYSFLSATYNLISGTNPHGEDSRFRHSQTRADFFILKKKTRRQNYVRETDNLILRCGLCRNATLRSVMKKNQRPFSRQKSGGLYEKLFAISIAVSGRNFGSKREAKCNQGSRKYAQQIFGKRSHNGVKLSYAILRST